MSATSPRLPDAAGDRDELGRRAREVAPVLAEHAAQGERERRVTQPAFDAMQEAGLLSLCVPREQGGLEADWHANLDVCAELARGDGAAGWVAAIINIADWIGGLFPAPVRAEIFGTPGNHCCGVLIPRRGAARRVEGGYQVDDAMWAFGSASLHVQWSAFNIPVVDAAGALVDQIHRRARSPTARAARPARAVGPRLLAAGHADRAAGSRTLRPAAAVHPRLTGESTMAKDPETVVRAFFDRMTEGGHIIDACETYFADDVVWENTGLPTANGKAEAIGAMQQFVDGFSMHALVVEVTHLSVDGDSVLTERDDHMDDADGNRAMSFHLAGVLDVRDGLIVSWRDYFDPRPLLPDG